MSEEIIVKFIVSEDVQTQQLPNKPVTNNIIINPLNIMRSRWIPTSLSLGVTVYTSGIDFSKEKDVQITLTNRKSGKTLYDSGITKISMPGPSSDNFTFTLGLKNIDFENVGYYDINFYLDGKKHTDYFKVLKIDDGNE